MESALPRRDARRDPPLNVRNTLVVALLAAALLLAAVFQSGQPGHGAAQPEDLVRRYVSNAEILGVLPGPIDLIGCTRWCWFRERQGSAVVLYHRPGDPADTLGWELAGISGGTWHSVSGGSGQGRLHGSAYLSVISAPVPPAAVTFRYGVRHDARMTLGRALRAEVATVEVAYDDGRVYRPGLTNEVFALFTEARAVCEISVYDGQGRLLEQVRAADDPLLAMHIARDAPGACQE